MSSFLKLNDGLPQLPIGGGYSIPEQMPSMRAPVPQIAAAGVGPIGGGTMIDRASFLSHPPMGNRGVSGYDAITDDIINGRIWPY